MAETVSARTGREARQRVVVTGGARGIGEALARRFATEGALVAVNDLDAERAAGVARDIGGVAVPGDASEALAPAREALGGEIDVFCANAGAAPAGGPEAPEELWASAWDVNVMAHVRAARELLPGWLDRGHGRFVATVSAAGLLTMVGSAPYSVSKHAAYAFAEWLHLTYRHRGVHVHAVCPQGVRTDMLRGTGRAGDLVLAPNAIEPEAVADALLEAVAEDRFLVLPHPETAGQYALRATDPGRWLGGMNRLQQKLERTLDQPEGESGARKKDRGEHRGKAGTQT
ncbi:SDR family oxidoreductase [Streptomyces sp. DSM 42041]|uniref:SDR family oxidoreductase n=1 Tax=Streptomyces hazeniae TaxID=3075538 RepID=A0ABU2NRR4_9ACTN|nr:SDR family oxidoreductase [Streptomyces sp. DSM 42041]MDT0379281.1 SDR family oxidoreductase [Streptomyces sp. DSM 42041]